MKQLKNIDRMFYLDMIFKKIVIYLTSSCVIWAFVGTHGPLKLSFHSSFKLAHSCQQKPKLHTNSLNTFLVYTRDRHSDGFGGRSGA
jgi:hypothetical protein